MLPHEEANVALALSMFEGISRGDRAPQRELFDPSCRYFYAGDLPFCGWLTKDQKTRLEGILEFATPLKLTVGGVIARDDRVWLEAECDALLEDGRRYQNTYVFMISFRNGKVVEYKVFMDTLHLYRMLEPDFEAEQQDPRQSALAPGWAATGDV